MLLGDSFIEKTYPFTKIEASNSEENLEEMVEGQPAEE